MSYPEMNLARRPYRDYRLFAVFVAVLIAAALGVTFLSVRGVVRGLSFNEATQARIQALEGGIREAKAEAESLKKSLSVVDFKRVQASSLRVNDLVGRRAFAWSRILEHLEGILPEDVRLIALATAQNDKAGGISVRITCITPVRDGLLRTVTALDTDPAFHSIIPGGFSDEEFSSSPGKKFDLAVQYEEEAP